MEPPRFSRFARSILGFRKSWRDADHTRVTALIEKETGPFGGVPRHLKPSRYPLRPEFPRKSAPNGNQMATICAPTSVHSRRSGTRLGGARTLTRRPSSGGGSRGGSPRRSLEREAKELSRAVVLGQHTIDPRGSRFAMDGLCNQGAELPPCIEGGCCDGEGILGRGLRGAPERS